MTASPYCIQSNDTKLLIYDQTVIKMQEIKMNKLKLIQVTFSLLKHDSPPWVRIYWVVLNNRILLIANKAKYLGLTLGKRLISDLHLKQLFHIFWNHLLIRNYLSNKFIIYKSSLVLWYPNNGAKQNVIILQAFQSICLRLITYVSWYITNKNLQHCIKISSHI